MKMRSQYIPEEARNTIMNFFCVPLNIFVCVVLYNVNAFPITIMFGMCSIFLFMASILQRRLMVVAEVHRSISCMHYLKKMNMNMLKNVWRMQCQKGQGAD